VSSLSCLVSFVFFPFFKFFHPKKEDRLTKKREQKTQSETALARTRANTGQALNGDNQTKTIFSRLIFDRSIYVPRSRPVRNRTHKQERRIITLDFFQFPPSVLPSFSLSCQKSTTNRAQKKIKSFFGKRDGYHVRAATACARTPVLTETLEDFLKEIFGATAARAEN
tara:strand:+ start:3681 stop:4184 length:504 start_codon:yes stop_codon:yes gene_type:complete